MNSSKNFDAASICEHITDKDSKRLNKILNKTCLDLKYDVYGELSAMKSKEEVHNFMNELEKDVSKKSFPSYKKFQSEVTMIAKNINTEQKVEKGVFECRKCGGNKTVSTQVQTRSGDESMTNFVTCIVCKNRWTE